MLRAARRQAPRLFSRQRYVCGDVEHLPFARDAFDLAFSSLAVQWCVNLEAAFEEVHRVVRPGGLFLFTTLGPDTLKELRAAFARVSEGAHVNAFLDMHDVGDMLGRAGFADPVMETEHITVEYEDLFTLMRDLKGLGAANATLERPRGLFGRRRLAALVDAYEDFRRDGRLPATWEVVFGHAWASARVAGSAPDTAVFPLARLRRR
jgi:malonyl-CoA O-methyltransferase